MGLHIVVLGAGYAGLAAAKLAARWTDARVTLVNAEDRFVQRVRLHQLAAGEPLPDLPLARLLRGTGVRLVVDRVTGIDAASKTVDLAGAAGGPLRYDLLIYALGSQDAPSPVPGVAEHAYRVGTLEQAARLRERLAVSRTVAVVGGGLTGIETAAELAESFAADVRRKGAAGAGPAGRTVRLVTGGALGAALSRPGADHLRRTFDRLGVEVRADARVAAVDADGLLLEDGGRVAADTVVWTTGFRVPDLARQAGFAVDEDGRVLVDPTLRSVSHPEVYAIGDAAAPRTPDGQVLRMACATSIPAAQQAARALAARLSGREPRPLRFRYALQCISLGRRDGLIQFVNGDDSPRERVLTGRKAAFVKEAVVRGTVFFQRHPTIPATR
ncbi:NAD(P)/FAD-dependent oxidoreductase [Streptomyces pactum]|uniref:NAD(P)/FAD-dependent oxidoreductase n=1 Tax=Streptomyces pactum TaxID=68249 RepID=UPI0037009B5F